MRFRTIILIVLLVLVGLFATVNWTAFTTPTTRPFWPPRTRRLPSGSLQPIFLTSVSLTSMFEPTSVSRRDDRSRPCTILSASAFS